MDKASRTTQRVRIGALVILTVSLALPFHAAAQTTRCEEAKKVRGSVSTITISAAMIRRSSGELINKPHITETRTYDSDGRKVTIVEHSVDWPGQDLPTTICEYDAHGRVTRETIRFDRQVQTITNWRYDAEGRLIERETLGRVPEQNFTVTYEHSPHTVTERYPGAGYDVRHFDVSGQIVKEVHHHADPARPATTTDFRRAPGELTKCWSGGEPPGCVTQHLDTWGNVVESSSTFGDKAATSYEIDSMGNWTMRRLMPLTARFGLMGPFDDVVFREITYRNR